MSNSEKVAQYYRDVLFNCPGVVWISNTGNRARVPIARQCPRCKAVHKLKGGKPEDHFCRILHCKRKMEFCWFCMDSAFGDWAQIPCTKTPNNIYEPCPNPVKCNE